MSLKAPVVDYDEAEDKATYRASDCEYMVDTGVFIECPGCAYHVTMDRAFKRGCWDHDDGCGRGPWSVEVIADE